MKDLTTKGKIIQVVGPIVDVRFKDQHLPELLTALEIPLKDDKKLTVEVAQQIGDDVVRCVSMGPTEGLVRGMDVISLEHPISVPVGRETLGRMFNVLGEPIDGKEEVKDAKRLSIHRNPPKFKDQSVKKEIFETGIKVIDLLCPYVRGGKIGLFGGATGMHHSCNDSRSRQCTEYRSPWQTARHSKLEKYRYRHLPKGVSLHHQK